MVNALGRAVFRTILFGADELRAITPPPLPGRTYLDNPTMLAQRRKRPAIVRHGRTLRDGTIEPIRKAFDLRRRRWVTNEV